MAMKTVLKRIGLVLGGLVLLVLVGVVAAMAVSKHRIARTWSVTPKPVAIPTDPAMIAEGQRLYAVFGCIECHGQNLAGREAFSHPLIGAFYGPNLTPAKSSRVSKFSGLDWVRAIRHGVRPDGSSIVFMLSDELNHLSDRDLGAIIAYAKSVPPVEVQQPPQDLKPMVHVLNALNILPLVAAARIDHEAVRPADPPPAATAEFGEHLAKATCVGCHGQTMSGGAIPGAPPSVPVPSNLTPHQETGLAHWTFADFDRAMRTGKRPDGTALNEFMPWKNFRQLNQDEMAALWAYLQQLPAKPFGGR
jgi:mono/diheme cytochrome c family protein